MRENAFSNFILLFGVFHSVKTLNFERATSSNAFQMLARVLYILFLL